MGSYQLHAWRDAMALAELLDETFGATKARKVYATFKASDLRTFEGENCKLIGDFIEKPEAQRPAVLRRMSTQNDEDTRIVFVVLAIIGCLRSKDVMEIRDAFRHSMAPGGGNRVTTAALYEFGERIKAHTASYAWPREVFDAAEIDC
ncbi:hypothetical protein [Roseateles asaccharophilus]|uniref:hypothetical protein n=1 Tax=Roseateles asaccharophilus TaxID=582607 RepID=UPI00384E24BA